MEISSARDAKLKAAPGRVCTPHETADLRTKLGALAPEWFVLLMERYPLAGAELTLAPDKDRAGSGVEMMWLDPAKIVDEAQEMYPGISATPHGYLPIGADLLGTGDPYFLKTTDSDDPAVVQIPHESAIGDDLDLNQIELVSDSLSSFIDDLVWD
jgi:hypothetical protein